MTHMRVVRSKNVVLVSKSACGKTEVGHLGANHVSTNAQMNPIMTSLHVHVRTQCRHNHLRLHNRLWRWTATAAMAWTALAAMAWTATAAMACVLNKTRIHTVLGRSSVAALA
jgi:hypothetical protein